MEIFAKTFNHAPSIRNITITDSEKTKLHPKMYEIGSGTSPRFDKFELANVRIYEIWFDEYFLFRALNISIQNQFPDKLE